MSVSDFIDASIAQGEHWTPIFTVRDSTGTVVDLTGAGVTLVLRAKRPEDTSVTTRTMGTANEYSYPASGTDGRIQFLFSPTETAAMSTGVYRLELVYGDTAPAPDNKVICARGSLVIYAPTTAPI